jgi:hypothetical protein
MNPWVQPKKQNIFENVSVSCFVKQKCIVVLNIWIISPQINSFYGMDIIFQGL